MSSRWPATSSSVTSAWSNIHLPRPIHLVDPARINGAPDLVVEILSPATAYYDLCKKFRVYERCGVREYWVVDPEEKVVEVYALKEGKFELAKRAEGAGEVSSDVIEGFAISVESIFC